MPAISRNLAAARETYGDAEASRAVHSMVTLEMEDGGAGLPAMSEEAHTKVGERMKSALFGGLDGIITTFSMIAAGAGAQLVDILEHLYRDRSARQREYEGEQRHRRDRPALPLTDQPNE